MLLSLLTLAALTQPATVQADHAAMAALAAKAVQAKPNDGALRFQLGRIRMIQWAESDEPVQEEGGKLVFSDGSTFMLRRDEQVTPEAAAALQDAVRSFNRAARIDSANGRYGLANAWAFEQLARNYKAVLNGASFGDFASEGEAWGKVAAEYRRTYAASKSKDLARRKEPDLGPEDRPSRTAAEQLIRLAGEKKARVTGAELKRLKAYVAQF